MRFKAIPITFDPAFTQPHPHTKLWWEQREKCSRCVHLVRMHNEQPDPDGTAHRCGATKEPAVQRVGLFKRRQAVLKGRRPFGARLAFLFGMYCIDAREEGAPCGPKAKLFKERDGA